MSNTKRILVAEDNLINQRVAVSMLEKIGFAAEVAENGLVAMRALANSDFDLVFMDCQMPELDGYDATRLIRASREVKNPEVPIIAMTANSSASDRDKCLEAGMNDYIMKPLKLDQINAVINRWLDTAPSA